MLPDKSIKCHRTAFTKSCFDGVVKCKCRLWMHVEGLDAAGHEIDVFGCADEFNVKMLHEIAKESRQTAASVDKVANEVEKVREQSSMERVHLINGMRASFPMLKLADQWEQRLLELGRDGDREREQRQIDQALVSGGECSSGHSDAPGAGRNEYPHLGARGLSDKGAG
jgi:hypothetical protein